MVTFKFSLLVLKVRAIMIYFDEQLYANSTCGTYVQ